MVQANSCVLQMCFLAAPFSWWALTPATFDWCFGPLHFGIFRHLLIICWRRCCAMAFAVVWLVDSPLAFAFAPTLFTAPLACGVVHFSVQLMSDSFCCFSSHSGHFFPFSLSFLRYLVPFFSFLSRSLQFCFFSSVSWASKAMIFSSCLSGASHRAVIFNLLSSFATTVMGLSGVTLTLSSCASLFRPDQALISSARKHLLFQFSFCRTYGQKQRN